MSAIRHSDRVFICGITESGKSVLARALAESITAPLTIIDPAGSGGTKIDGAVTVNGPEDDTLGTRRSHSGHALLRQVYERLGEASTRSPIIRYVPYMSDRIEEYEAVYRWQFDRCPAAMWVDELGEVMPASGRNRWGRKYLTQGRKRELGHIGCHTRPRELDTNIMAQSQHTFIFQLPNPADRAHVAGSIGVKPAELDEILDSLPPFGFAWHQQRTRTLIACDPLEL